ncbi:werner syndrome, recq helicase-like [Plakobranchus ocellatus]|uniref:Werner syndrome, recq helicase-like n=1 Tax=Plakobranchus ocellatus TaxID=259542 RepID=A0AAV3XZ36_9GAST|nr:werner syndrome, recq helicase-like [Plakobranchus ocellatus]
MRTLLLVHRCLDKAWDSLYFYSSTFYSLFEVTLNGILCRELAQESEGTIKYVVDAPDRGRKRCEQRPYGVATLLCYLELHLPLWLEMFNPVYSLCTVRCYGGPAQLQAIAKKCPPVAVAIARQKLEGKSFCKSSELEFKVVDVCDSMGWDSRLVKRELRALQWTSGPDGFSKSGVLVEFSDLSFHFRSRGDLTSDQMDDVLDFLNLRARRQEQTELAQLDMLSQALVRVSHKNYWMCCDEADRARSNTLKRDLEAFFDREHTGGENIREQQVIMAEPDTGALSQLHFDIRQFISLYGQDHILTGRSIARVFHGIGSPNFPAETWGRVRRFWRAHLHVAFPVIIREATKIVVAMR